MTFAGVPALLLLRLRPRAAADAALEVRRSCLSASIRASTRSSTSIAKYGRMMDEAYGRETVTGRILPGKRLPVVIATAAIALGWLLTLPIPGYSRPWRSRRSPGARLLASTVEEPIVFAFLGAYFFALNLVFRGYVRGDLRPKTYSQITVRGSCCRSSLAFVLGQAFATNAVHPSRSPSSAACCPRPCSCRFRETAASRSGGRFQFERRAGSVRGARGAAAAHGAGGNRHLRSRASGRGRGHERRGACPSRSRRADAPDADPCPSPDRLGRSGASSTSISADGRPKLGGRARPCACTASGPPRISSTPGRRTEAESPRPAKKTSVGSPTSWARPVSGRIDWALSSPRSKTRSGSIHSSTGMSGEPRRWRRPCSDPAAVGSTGRGLPTWPGERAGETRAGSSAHRARSGSSQVGENASSRESPTRS